MHFQSQTGETPFNVTFPATHQPCDVPPTVVHIFVADAMFPVNQFPKHRYKAMKANWFMEGTGCPRLLCCITGVLFTWLTDFMCSNVKPRSTRGVIYFASRFFDIGRRTEGIAVDSNSYLWLNSSQCAAEFIWCLFTLVHTELLRRE